MSDLTPITPLGSTEARIDRIGSLTISENPDRALASLTARSGQEANARSVAKTLLGFEMPDSEQTASGDTYNAFWIGPESWLIDARYTGNELMAKTLKTALGDAASIVEQTDAWCRFDVEGEKAIELFERLCSANVRASKSGWVTRTTIHHLGCFLVHNDQGWSVLGPRSSAGSLHHALIAAAHSVS